MKKTLLAILAASTLSGCFDDNNAVEKGMSQQYSDLSAAHVKSKPAQDAFIKNYQDTVTNNLVTEVNGYFNIKNIMSTLTALEGLSKDTKAALAASNELQITKQMKTGAVASNLATELDKADFNDLIFASHDLNTDDDTDAVDAAENNRIGASEAQVSAAQEQSFNNSVCHLVFGTKDNQAGQEIELSINKKLIADADAKKILAAMEGHFYSCAKDPADQSKLMATGRILVDTQAIVDGNLVTQTFEFHVNKNSKSIYVKNDWNFDGSADNTAEDHILQGTDEFKVGTYYSYDLTPNQTKKKHLEMLLAEAKSNFLIAAHKVATVATARAPYVDAAVKTAQEITDLKGAKATYDADPKASTLATFQGVIDQTLLDLGNLTVLTHTTTDSETTLTEYNAILQELEGNTKVEALLPAYNKAIKDIPAGAAKTDVTAKQAVVTRLGYRIEAVEADIAVDAAKAAEKASTDTAQADTLKKAVTDAEATAKTKAEVVAKLDAVEKAEAADKKTSTTATKSAVTKATKALTDLIAKNDKAEADANAAA